LAIVLLIVAAFALGWWGRGHRTTKPPAGPPRADLDQAVRHTLIAFQAALSLWQAQGSTGASSPQLARQSVAAFEHRRTALAAATLEPGAAPEAQAALTRAQRAAGRLADGLAGFADGAPLEVGRERALISAERALTAARIELGAASANGSEPG
jgi:hypothetical protein